MCLAAAVLNSRNSPALQRAVRNRNSCPARTCWFEVMATCVNTQPSSKSMNAQQCPAPVSYTHLDVYKRQALQSAQVAECMPGFVEGHPMPCLPATVQPRLWVGNRVTTPAHFDASRNLAVVVCGRRRFTLFPTEQVANLYIGPLDFAPTGAAITLARPDKPDFERHPRLREALANALVAELEPGDALYMPPLLSLIHI